MKNKFRDCRNTLIYCLTQRTVAKKKTCNAALLLGLKRAVYMDLCFFLNSVMLSLTTKSYLVLRLLLQYMLITILIKNFKALALCFSQGKFGKH